MGNVSKRKRSEMMSKIRSKWTKPERVLHKMPHPLEIPHRHHSKMVGSPGFLCGKTAVFVDGCFWHNCPLHCARPKTNKKFWNAKIDGNAAWGRKNDALLGANGYLALRIWEHDLRGTRWNA